MSLGALKSIPFRSDIFIHYVYGNCRRLLSHCLCQTMGSGFSVELAPSVAIPSNSVGDRLVEGREPPTIGDRLCGDTIVS